MMVKLLICHTIAYSLGFILDLIIGDPYSLPHPIRWIGTLIGVLDEKLLWKKNISRQELESINRNPIKERLRGIILVIIVLTITAVCAGAVLIVAYSFSLILGVIIEAIMTAYVYACKSLKVESMKVYAELEKDDLAAARQAVSMIVGRDTVSLDEEGVTKATVETIAENTSDGVIAPMIYTCIGGPVLGFIYKAINTCDSMIGYHNDRYEHFGTAAARLDDVVNYIPARLSAIYMIMAVKLLGNDYSSQRAIQIFKRDRYNHKSPNSAQTESICAGALGVMLAGDASYFGKVVHKPTIGDATRPIEIQDIIRTNKLLYGTAIIGFVMGLIILGLIFVGVGLLGI